MTTLPPASCDCHVHLFGPAARYPFSPERPGTVVVPGHDLPMVLDDGKPRYLGKRRASIRAWFGDDMASQTEIDLVALARSLAG